MVLYHLCNKILRLLDKPCSLAALPPPPSATLHRLAQNPLGSFLPPHLPTLFLLPGTPSANTSPFPCFSNQLPAGYHQSLSMLLGHLSPTIIISFRMPVASSCQGASDCKAHGIFVFAFGIFLPVGIQQMLVFIFLFNSRPVLSSGNIVWTLFVI